MSDLPRRSFLKAALVAGGGLAVESVFARFASAQVWSNAETPYGPLTPRPARDSTVTALALPPGFEYRILTDHRRTMSDGVQTPFAADGMAAFEVGGFIRLVRNHELPSDNLPGPRLGQSLDFYDGKAGGGTTTMIVDPLTRRVLRDFVSLSGTARNCSGGPTPWGSWISCEETLISTEQGFEQKHGYCFEVPAAADRPVPAVPLRAMGRFLHEGIAVDDRTGYVYLTEDSGSAGFYRFIPRVPGRLAEGGRLQMLAIPTRPSADLIVGQVVGRTLPVSWVDIPNPDPTFTSAEPQPVYRQGRDRRAAKFQRLEGVAYRDGVLMFTSTSGGERSLGQLWRYRPFLPASPSIRRRAAVSRSTEGELTLMYESTDQAVLKAPDNIAISKRGSVVICEDPPDRAPYVRVYTPDGQLFDLAYNVLPGGERSEFAGATFSPDGKTLFLNIFAAAMTIAIWRTTGEDVIG